MFFDSFALSGCTSDGVGGTDLFSIGVGSGLGRDDCSGYRG